MRPYETIIILDSQAEDAIINSVIDRIVETIKNDGATIAQVDRWGKRRFAYEINHQSDGYYVLLEFTAGTETVAEVDRLLSITDEVVRHKILRLPDSLAGRSVPKPRSSRSSSRTASQS